MLRKKEVVVENDKQRGKLLRQEGCWEKEHASTKNGSISFTMIM